MGKKKKADRAARGASLECSEILNWCGFGIEADWDFSLPGTYVRCYRRDDQSTKDKTGCMVEGGKKQFCLLWYS